MSYYSVATEDFLAPKSSDVVVQGGGETVYAQFDIWKENAIWGEQQSSAAPTDPPPYPAYGRYAPPTASSQQASSSSYFDMAYVLQVNNRETTSEMTIFRGFLALSLSANFCTRNSWIFFKNKTSTA
jgi:hypothetical protein